MPSTKRADLLRLRLRMSEESRRPDLRDFVNDLLKPG